jgi:ABC-type multidrug transport system fused ATPase/permease subunit
MQRIEGFLSEGEVPNWASTLTCDLSNSSQSAADIGFSEAVFEWDECPDNASPSRFRLGPLNFMFPAGKLTLVSGSTGSGKTALLSALLGGNRPHFLSCRSGTDLCLEMHCLSGSVHINKVQHRVAYCGQNPCEPI